MVRNKKNKKAEQDRDREPTPQEQAEHEHRDAATETEAGEPSLEDRVAELEDKLAAAEESALRARADFQNYQRRAITNERDAREWGAAGVLESMVSVIDHFDVALSQDPEKSSAASIIDGVKLIKGEMIRALKDHGVTAIEPGVGDELDPGRHEAIGHRATEGVEPGRVSMVMQVGYAMGDRVLRPAKVFVAPEE
jgi:molecular chaperone GrpE